MGASPQVRPRRRPAARPETRPLVVASMIVRDEEAMLGDCLASLEGFVDEVVICDTGSTDSTVAIAEAAGARVIHRQWKDDFSAARNAVLDECRHAEWVLWIDADERLDCSDPGALREALVDPSLQKGECLLLDVENRRRHAATSISTGPRIFRPSGLVFRGPIHEELRRTDGSPPLAVRFDRARLTHLGYDEQIVGARGKAERNLAIARRAAESAATPKAALDLVRSLGFAGRPASEMLSAAEQGLSAAVERDAIFLELLATKANLQLQLEQVGAAFDDAAAVLSEMPDHDVAVAVFARAATDLGRYRELIEVMAGEAASGTATRIPANRAEALMLAADAAARFDTPETVERFIADAASLLDGDPARWDRLLAGLAGADPKRTVPVLCEVAGPEARDVVVAAGRVWGAEAVAAMGLAPDEELGAGEALGISLSFGGSRLPVDVALLADWVPAGRRVVEWTGVGEFAERLRLGGGKVTSIDANNVLSELEALSDGSRFDVAIGGLTRGEPERVLDRLRSIIDPAGIVGLWDVDNDGMVVVAPGTGLAGFGSGHLDRALMEAHGFVPWPQHPSGIVAGRPIWDEGSLLVDEGTPTDRTLLIWSDQPLSTEMRMAYRASIPGDVALEVVCGLDPTSVLADMDPDAPVLITASHIVPDPGWIQASLDAFSQRDRPAGPRLVDSDHRVVHAGLTADGRSIGCGEDSSGSLMQTDRTVPMLGVPFVASSRSLRTSSAPAGDVIGSAVAIALDPVEQAGRGVGLDEMFGATILLLGGPPPGRGHPDLEDEIDQLLEQLITAGFTPVYQWEDRSEDPDPFVLQRWRGRGVVAFPPSPLRRQPARFSPDPVQPRADALAAAFDPGAIVFLSAQSLEWDYVTVSEGSVARSFYTGPEAGDLMQRVDVVCSCSDLTGRLAEEIGDGEVASIIAIPDIESVDQVAGLVSIVIPVYDRWKLTKQCLRSIRAHTPAPHEIIIVDNGSTDGTAAGLAAADVIVITNDENRGFPVAVNQGIAASRGEYVCVLNNDTEVTTGWLEAMLEALSVPNTGLVGPRSNRIAGLQQVPGAPALAERSKATAWAKQWKRSCGGRSWRVPRLIGFCMLARRSTFEEFGGFDEGFGIGNFEDDEFGCRLMATGLSLRVADGSVVLHHGGATFKKLGLDFAALMSKGRRHLGDRRQGAAGGTLTIVLSDGNPTGAATGAATAMPISDRVRIAERGALASTEIAAAGVRGGVVEVVAADWATDDGAKEVLGPEGGSLVLVMGSSEQVEYSDWGQVRAELESMDGSPSEVPTPTGSEVRIVRGGPAAMAEIGTHGEGRVQAFKLI